MKITKEELKDFKYVNDQVAYDAGRNSMLKEATTLLGYFLEKNNGEITIQDSDIARLSDYDVIVTLNENLSRTYKLQIPWRLRKNNPFEKI